MQINRPYTGHPSRYFNFERFENEITVDVLVRFLSKKMDLSNLDLNKEKLTFPSETLKNFLAEDYLSDLEKASKTPFQLTEKIQKTTKERILSALTLDFSDTIIQNTPNPELTPEIQSLKMQASQVFMSQGGAILEGIKYLADKNYITITNKEGANIDYLEDDSTVEVNQTLIDKISN
ncbi:hypothetical protein CL656_03495 [bacterium]|nr:hypothetical protein [bacterium]